MRQYVYIMSNNDIAQKIAGETNLKNVLVVSHFGKITNQAQMGTFQSAAKTRMLQVNYVNITWALMCRKSIENENASIYFIKIIPHEKDQYQLGNSVIHSAILIR